MAIPCCVAIEASERGVRQTCGKFSGTSLPGCAFFCYPWTQISPVSIRVEQLDVQTDTKTLDNVSVRVVTAVQYQIDFENDGFDSDLEKSALYKAVFTLDNPRRQMSAYVDDGVRSEMPTLTLDAAYEAKTEIADNVHKELSTAMHAYGYKILKVLVTDLQPDARVQSAMNDINTQKRQRAAAQERAEAEKMLKVKAAEADMEAKHLSGVGIAKMRKAITSGFQDSISAMKDSCGLEASDVVHMMLVTQYMDTLKDYATTGKSSIVMAHNPAAMSDIETQIRQGFVNAKASSASN